MTGFLTDYKGRTFKLAQILSWDISHGMGQPCDAFELAALYDADMLEILSDSVRFRAEHEGEVVFCGVVDEYEISAGEKGLAVTISGRSLAALLLDNEAEAAEYYNATAEHILDRHVYPWGVSEVRLGSLPAVSRLSVASGSSQWRILEDYAFFCCGIRPRFSRDGVLLLDNSLGAELEINRAAISEQLYREKRYGLVSQVLVKNRSAVSVSENGEFIARGGSCRRVINVPRATFHDTMRHTGSYRLERSKEGSLVCEIALPALFAAFPGDRVALGESPIGITGSFIVTRSRCWANGVSAGTRLTMEPEKNLKGYG